jgi:hypothetical protein
MADIRPRDQEHNDIIAVAYAQRATSTFEYPHHSAAGSVLFAHMPVGVERSGGLLRELDVQSVLVAQTIGMRPCARDLRDEDDQRSAIQFASGDYAACNLLKLP